MMTLLDIFGGVINLVGFTIVLLLIMIFLLSKIYAPVKDFIYWYIRPIIVSGIFWGVILIEIGLYSVFSWNGVFIGSLFLFGMLLIIFGIYNILRN